MLIVQTPDGEALREALESTLEHRPDLGWHFDVDGDLCRIEAGEHGFAWFRLNPDPSQIQFALLTPEEACVSQSDFIDLHHSLSRLLQNFCGPLAPHITISAAPTEADQVILCQFDGY